MVEIRACQLKRGDEFSMDGGESFTTVLEPLCYEDAGKKLLAQTDTGPWRLLPNAIVLLREKAKR